jgi:tRNA G18 (ribose-2'-O)-methylase SpoU
MLLVTPERLPYRATTGAEAYDQLRLPAVFLLDHVRSMYNVGAFFRTADGAGLQKLWLTGITAQPTQPAVAKTALGAEATVAWEYHHDARLPLRALRSRGYQIAALETSPHAVDLFDWRPRWPVCVLFGNEVEGIGEDLLAECDVFVRLPMLGLKHSLNVATAAGVVAYELLRKYRDLRLGTPS